MWDSGLRGRLTGRADMRMRGSGSGSGAGRSHEQRWYRDRFALCMSDHAEGVSLFAKANFREGKFVTAPAPGAAGRRPCWQEPEAGRPRQSGHWNNARDLENAKRFRGGAYGQRPIRPTCSFPCEQSASDGARIAII